MDLISVIVPVYKVEPYLDKCVQSIVDQTYRSLEIILVDDGSPDNCGAMCDAWAAKDSRIKVIHKKNGGLSDARNAGMTLAEGDYISFVDSDDWLDLQFLSHLHRALRETGAGIAACDLRMIYEGAPEEAASAEQVPMRLCTPEEAIGSILCGREFRAVACNKLYHRSYLEGEHFRIGKHHEDEFFTYRILAKAEKLVYVDCPLYFYLQRGGSIMHTVSMKRLDALDAYLERLAFLKERFPALYLQDKINFCFSCSYFYRQGLRLERDDRAAFLRRVRDARRQVRFSAGELSCMTAKQKLYVLLTGSALAPFSKLLNLKEGTPTDE